MVGATHKIPDHPSYSYELWFLGELAPTPALRERGEALFALGNGFIGIRGQFEEDALTGDAPIYLNGVYERVPINYHEKAVGFADSSDVRPPAPNALPIELKLNGQLFDLSQGEILSYSRRIEFDQGVGIRNVEWQAPDGQKFWLHFERLVSFGRPNCAAIRLAIRPLSGPAEVEITSHLNWVAEKNDAQEEGVHDPRIGPSFTETPWQDFDAHAKQDINGFTLRTKKSGISVTSLISHEIDTEGEVQHDVRFDDNVEEVFSTSLEQDGYLIFEKYIVYTASSEADQRPTLDRALEAMAEAKQLKFRGLRNEQVQFLDNYWAGAAINIQGDQRLDTALKFCMFHILQGCGRDDATSIGAKGQTGEGYEGHYFWDAEIFSLPLLLFTAPDMARAMLIYRHRKLEDARTNARIQGHEKGALYPWRTISGKECSAYFPAGTAQYHIIADIAFAISQYVETTGDEDFLVRFGAEMLFETARIWPQIGFFNEERGGKFCINMVTGPDEYTALVNNNLYTNAMAKAHLMKAAEATEHLKSQHPDEFARLVEKLELNEEEIALWRKAAEQMELPYDEERQLFLQDDSFLERKIWDFANTPDDKYPLLLHYAPLEIYRHQVCKQADAVLAAFLQKSQFSKDDRKRIFDYYESVTVHDSTLSPCVFSTVAADVGALDKATYYLAQSALVDLEDLHGNASHGVHMASSGGSWMALANGFAGMEASGSELSFSPQIPSGWTGYDIRLRYQGRILKLCVKQNQATYSLIDGEALAIRHFDKAHTLNPGQDLELDLPS